MRLSLLGLLMTLACGFGLFWPPRSSWTRSPASASYRCCPLLLRPMGSSARSFFSPSGKRSGETSSREVNGLVLHHERVKPKNNSVARWLWLRNQWRRYGKHTGTLAEFVSEGAKGIV